MRLMPYLAFLSLIIHLSFGTTALCLGPRARLNRAFAIISAFTAVWSLGEMLFYGATSLQTIRLGYRISAFGWTFLPPALLCIAFALSDLPARRIVRLAVLLPVAALSARILLFVLTDPSFILTIRATPLGNEGLPVESVWFLIYLALTYGSILTIIAFAIYSRRRSASRRYRELALIFVLAYLAAIAANLFANHFLPLIWRYSALPAIIPDSTILFLIVRYRFIRLDFPALQQEILQTVEEPVFLVDHELHILKGNPAASDLLSDGDGRAPEVSVTSLFDSPATTHSLWQEAIGTRMSANVTAASRDGESYLLTLVPYFDRFGDLIGGTVIAHRYNPLDDATTRFGITPREKQVALKLMLGYSNPEIAEIFSITPGTVKTHVHNIYQKTGAANRVELVRRFLENGGPVEYDIGRPEGAGSKVARQYRVD